MLTTKTKKLTIDNGLQALWTSNTGNYKVFATMVVPCFADTFMQVGGSFLRLTFRANNPLLRNPLK